MNKETYKAYLRQRLFEGAPSEPIEEGYDLYKAFPFQGKNEADSPNDIRAFIEYNIQVPKEVRNRETGEMEPSTNPSGIKRVFSLFPPMTLKTVTSKNVLVGHMEKHVNELKKRGGELIAIHYPHSDVYKKLMG